MRKAAIWLAVLGWGPVLILVVVAPWGVAPEGTTAWWVEGAIRGLLMLVGSAGVLLAMRHYERAATPSE